MKKQVAVLGVILAVWGGLYVTEKGVLKGDISQKQARVVTSENLRNVSEQISACDSVSQNTEKCLDEVFDRTVEAFYEVPVAEKMKENYRQVSTKTQELYGGFSVSKTQKNNVSQQVIASKRKILFDLIRGLEPNPIADENYCVGERLAKINLLSQQAENCQIDMTGKSESTEMMSVYFDGVACLKQVAYRIFDDYYDHYRDEVRQNFDAYVEKARQLTVSMKKQSEIARVNQTALFYDLEAETNWYFMVREAVFEYLKAMREECQSYDETA
jgi:hypothetical protein